MNFARSEYDPADDARLGALLRFNLYPEINSVREETLFIGLEHVNQPLARKRTLLDDRECALSFCHPKVSRGISQCCLAVMSFRNL